MKKEVKLLFLFLLTIYLGSTFAGTKFYFLLSQTQKDEVKNFLIVSINSAKSSDGLYWNNVFFLSVVTVLSYLIIWGLSNLNKYLQILNIGTIIFKGFVFGLTTTAFFMIYKFRGIPFFFIYILLKELIVLIFLIILILYSLANRVIKDRAFRIERKFNIVIGFIVGLLICGIIVMDTIVSKFACSLI